MTFSTQVKSIAYLETLCLLKILEIGQHQIEAGNFRVAEDVFAELDKELVEDTVPT